jgi:hypothetical protein
MTIQIPDEVKQRCWSFLQHYNIGTRYKANGSKEQQYVGLVGEVMIKELLQIDSSLKDGYDGGFDLMYKGFKIDVKTMGRTCDPKPHYVNNFIAMQEGFDCDLYIFNSINKKSNKLTICGYISKEELLTHSVLYKEGEKRYRTDGSYFKLKADTYEIENKHLKNIHELWD